MRWQIGACLLWLTVAIGASATPVKIDATPAALANAMQGHRVVLLGEVHDNAGQHALRVAALRELLVAGVRPAIALEQFDRDTQSDIDAARRKPTRDADFLIARAHADPSWDWEFYRPFIALALEYDLPIVAANLSRNDAMRVATDGWTAIFDAKTVSQLKLDRLPADFRRKHEDAIAVGHCNLLPRAMLAPSARAQMARDIVMALSIRPYVDRGVVLLAGNGHVRRDLGVPFWLSATTARSSVSIGILEREDDGSVPGSTAHFDAYVVTDRAERADPCKGLAERQRDRR